MPKWRQKKIVFPFGRIKTAHVYERIVAWLQINVIQISTSMEVSLHEKFTMPSIPYVDNGDIWLQQIESFYVCI